MPNSDGEVRVEITGDSSKIKKELKETEAAVRNTVNSVSEMTDALEDTSGAGDNLKEVADSAEEAAKAVSNVSAAAESFEDITENADSAAKSISKAATETDSLGDSIYNLTDSGLEIVEKSATKAEKAVEGVTNETDNLGDSIEKAGQQTITFSDLLKANLLSDYIQKGIGKLADSFWGFLKKGVDLASNLQEVQNVVDTTFGDGAEKIYKWADAAAESFGMSSLQAQNFNGTLGAMLKSMGITDNAVLKMSTDMVGLAGDMASFYNLPVEQAFEKIRAGISGETEPLKQLGINMSVANLEAYALSQGIETAYDKMSQSEQAILRYNYLMSVTAEAQGDFAKTSDSFANQQRILQLQAENLSASLGEKLLPSLNNVLQTANDKLPKLENTAENIGEVLGKVTEFALENHETILSLITAYGTFYGVMKAGNAINTAVTAVKSLTTATKAAETAQHGMNAAAAANPYVLLASAIAVVTVGLIAYANSVDSVHNRIKDVNKEVKELKENTEESIASTEAEIAVFKDKARQYEELREKANRTAGEEERLKELAEELQQYMPEGTQLINEQTGAYNSLADSVDNVAAAMRRKATIAAYEDEYTELIKKQLEAQKAFDEANAKFSESPNSLFAAKDFNDALKSLNAVNDELDATEKKLIALRENSANETKKAVSDFGGKIGEGYDLPEESLEDYEKNLKAKIAALDDNFALRRISEEQYYSDLKDYLDKHQNFESKEYFSALGKYEDYLDKKQDAAKKGAEKEKSAAEKAAKEQQEAEKKRIENSVTALKDRLEADKTYTKEMYYNDLEALISTLDKESDLYKKYYSEILKGRRDLADAAEKQAQQEAKKLLSEQEKIVEKSLSNILKAFQKTYNELEKKRENYRKKLLSVSGDLFSMDEIENPDGTKTKRYTINNIEEQIKKMRQYNADVAKLKKQGVSSALLEELTSLSDGDSQQFASFLSGLTDEELAKINEAYEEKRRAADELSKEMYADEYAAIADGINTALDEVSAGAADKGKEAAEIYAKAFGDTLLKHSEDFYPLLGDEKYMKWFGAEDTPNLFGGNMDKIMKMFMGSNFADIAAKVTSTVWSEQARYSAPAYTAAAGTASEASAADSGRKSDIAAILEKLNKPLPIMLDGKVIAEAVMTYQNNYMRKTGG